MRIAYILNTYPAPSQSFIRREIRALEAQGICIFRIAMRPWEGPLVDPADQAEAEATFYVTRAGLGAVLQAVLKAFVRAPRGMLAALSDAIRLARGSETGLLWHLIYWVEAAVVAARVNNLGAMHMHAHFGTNAATVAMLAKRIGGKPFSFTVHGPEEFDKVLSLALPQKLARADFAVAISHFGLAQLRRHLDPEQWPKLHVVRCGINQEAFSSPTPLPAGRPLRLLAIGRLAEQKGYLTLIEALTALRKRGVEVTLTVCGDGPLRPLLERAIAAGGLSGQVALLGWCSEAKVQAELARAQALVLPSYAEGLPVVAMEAMAAARPVIATWVAGIPELVQPGETGWLVPPADPRALAEAIAEAAESPHARLAEMGERGRARVLALHSIETSAALLVRLFAQRPRAHSR